MYLIDTRTGERRNVGDRVKTFRGEDATVTGIRNPSHPGSTGRVIVRLDGSDHDREFFPNVCGLRQPTEAEQVEDLIASTRQF